MHVNGARNLALHETGVKLYFVHPSTRCPKPVGFVQRESEALIWASDLTEGSESVPATWELEPHTKAKHEILRLYLNAWYPKVTAYNRRVVFIDGFAGPGIYKGGEAGSPIIALDTLLQHNHLPKIRAGVSFVFIEQDAQRLDSLRAQIAMRKLPGNVSVETYHGASDEALDEAFAGLDQQGLTLAPTLALLDPFGVKGVRMEHIKRFMDTRGCEVLITFMSSRIHRFGNTPEYRKHLSALFGTDGWEKALDLEGPARLDFIRSLFKARLEAQDGAGARYTRYFFMRDRDNRPVYELAFASNHAKGIDSMKDAMWKLDPIGGAAFSSFNARAGADVAAAPQLALLEQEPDWHALFKELAAKFRGQRVPWPEVEEEIRRSAFQIRRQPIKAEARRPNAMFAITNPRGSALDRYATLTFKP